MFLKYIIFDLDDTLYNYEINNQYALSLIHKKINHNFNISFEISQNTLDKVKKDYKVEVGNIASSHNRYIYLKHMFENLKIPLKFLDEYHRFYWDSFFQNCKPEDTVLEFLTFFKDNYPEIKLVILTDFTAKEQFDKLHHLKIFDFFDLIITSEEIGIEKPSIKTFNYVLSKLNCSRNEVIMIGNDFNKDILGSISSNIYAFHFDKKNKDFIFTKNYCSFNNFKQLLTFFKNFNFEINQFERISKYCGQRFDLSQAGGGNISFKLNNLLFVKSSGISLSDVSKKYGYSIVLNDLLIEKENLNTDINLTELTIINNSKPSIETYMHSLLKKYIVHLHPLMVNKISIRNDGKYIFKKLFQNSLILDYVKPGIKIYEQIKKSYNNEQIIFLMNHGVIYTSDNIEEIYKLIEDTEEKIKKFLEIEIFDYKSIYDINFHLNKIFKENFILYSSDDIIINKYIKENKERFFLKPLFPDYIVYCGEKPLEIDIKKDLEIQILNYLHNYKTNPNIIICNDKLFIYGKNKSKCRDIEEVLKYNLLLVEKNENFNFLNEEEIKFITFWDEEKYRKLI